MDPRDGESRVNDDAVSELVAEFRERGLVPRAVRDDVEELLDAGEERAALEYILDARRRQRRRSGSASSDFSEQIER